MKKNLLHICMSLAFLSIVASNVAPSNKTIKANAAVSTSLSTSLNSDNINNTSISPDTANELKSALDQHSNESMNIKAHKYYHSSGL